MHRARRALFAIGLLLVAWSALVAITGGFSVSVLTLKIASHDPIRPLVAGIVALAAFFVLTGRSGIHDEFRGVPVLIAGLRNHGAAAARAVAICGAISIFVFAVHWGAFIAGGADSSGYLSQADLWRQGSLHIPQPLAASLPWPNAQWTLSPLGYRPSTDGQSIVPVYSPGLPLLMAAAQVVTGMRCSRFYIVPLAAAVVIYAAFLIARALGGSAAGALAALLTATSPAFLFQAVFPMSDVPVAAAWGAALAVIATTRGARGALLAGIFAGAAVMIRPNLALVTVPIGLFFLADRDSAPSFAGRLRLAALYAPGVVIAALAIAAINTNLYGSPLESGYGALRAQYEWRNFLPNLQRYLRWAIESHSLAILVALASPALLVGRSRLDPRGRRVVLLLIGVALVIVGSYLFYIPFDDWWYLRFVLTALLCAFVLMSVVIIRALRPLVPTTRLAVLAAVAVALVVYQAHYAVEKGVFGLRQVEQRYPDAAAAIAQLTPENAVIVAMQESGSVRYYAHRLTLRWDVLLYTRLDQAVAEFARQGRPVYFLLEEWEEAKFKRIFAGTTALGRLDWPPIAQMDRPMRVRLYDPTQRTLDLQPMPMRASTYDCRRPF